MPSVRRNEIFKGPLKFVIRQIAPDERALGNRETRFRRVYMTTYNFRQITRLTTGGLHLFTYRFLGNWIVYRVIKNGGDKIPGPMEDWKTFTCHVSHILPANPEAGLKFFSGQI